MKLSLPSGRRVEIVTRGAPQALAAGPCAPLYSELARLVAQGAVTIDARLDDLALADFHTVRAALTKLGWIAEEPLELACRNCGEELRCKPCAEMSIGPLMDGERDDELDATLPFGERHPIPPVPLVTGGTATDVVFEARTLAEARQFHVALTRRRLRLTPAVIRAMGVVALGTETRVDRIAPALQAASEEAWAAVGDGFLATHYPPRLFAAIKCAKCGARNDVDAPYDRELEPSSDEDSREIGDDSNAETAPTFAEFDAAARRIGEELLGAGAAAGVALVVEGGVPACDDGGEPLLGSYVPGHAGDGGAPSRQPEITVYFRTFCAMWSEDGPFDWEAELRETIEHELAHHVADLAGDDPVDDDERREIAREAQRIHGKRAIARGELSAFGSDVASFVRRTWPIWLLLALATIATTLMEVR